MYDCNAHMLYLTGPVSLTVAMCFRENFAYIFFWVEMTQFMLKLYEMTLKVDFSA